MSEPSDEEVRDELPSDLVAAGYVGPYKFPDNSRRRIPGVLYLVSAAVCLAIYFAAGDDAVLSNSGFVFVAVLLAVVGVINITSGWKMTVDETDALLAATTEVGFPVGHASAQLSWRGLRSRPTWRILCYSAEEPPTKRGFVLVDAIDRRIVSAIVEDNPEGWDLDEMRPATASGQPDGAR